MPIEKPEASTYHQKRDTTTLHFKDQNSAEYLMRGGLCWPTLIIEGNQERIEGYALILGVNLRTGVATMFEETPFTCIDHIIDSTGKIKYRGLAPWLNKCWSQYFCSKFYWRDSSATYGRYMRDIRRSAMVKPKPVLPETIWDEEADVSHLVSMMAMEGKLRVNKDGGFITQQRAYQTNRALFYPARQAMMACVAGMDQFRWRRGNEEYD